MIMRETFNMFYFQFIFFLIVFFLFSLRKMSVYLFYFNYRKYKKNLSFKMTVSITYRVQKLRINCINCFIIRFMLTRVQNIKF